MTSPTTNAVAIMGATATGKSDVAIHLAEVVDGEIISMDSRQVYRGLDIGTAKVSNHDRQRVPHHLVDILDPTEANSAGKHVERVHEAMGAIQGRGRTPIIAGGTGLYFRALFAGLIDAAVPAEELRSIRSRLDVETTQTLYEELTRIDPERARALSPNDRQRIVRAIEVYESTGKPHSRHMAEQEPTSWPAVKIVLSLPRDLLRRRIAERTRAMFDAGWVGEVRSLLERGVPPDAPAMNSLGYGEIVGALTRGEDPAAQVGRIVTRTQQYAKRQETFFRSVSDARWVDMSAPDAQDAVEGLVRGALEF